MHELLFFIIGCLLGGIVGVVTMCLVQINPLKRYSYFKEGGQ